MEVRRQLEVSSLLPLCGSWGLGSAHQDWWQRPLLYLVSHFAPSHLFLEQAFNMHAAHTGLEPSLILLPQPPPECCDDQHASPCPGYSQHLYVCTSM